MPKRPDQYIVLQKEASIVLNFIVTKTLNSWLNVWMQWSVRGALSDINTTESFIALSFVMVPNIQCWSKLHCHMNDLIEKLRTILFSNNKA